MKYFKSALLLSSFMLASCNASQVYKVQVKKSDYWDIASVEKSDSTLYKKAKNYLASADYGLAIDAFRQDLKVNGPSVKTLNGLAITYDMLGRYDLSGKYYQKALNLKPDSPLTYTNLAYSQYKQGEYENAVQFAQSANQVNQVFGQDQDQDRVFAHIAQNTEAVAHKKSRQHKLPATREEDQETNKPSHVIERVGENEWAMVKPKAKPLYKKEVKYKSNIEIAKIMQRKAELIKQKEATKQTENSAEKDNLKDKIEEKIAHMEIESQAQKALSKPLETEQKSEENYVKLAFAPAPSSKPNIKKMQEPDIEVLLEAEVMQSISPIEITRTARNQPKESQEQNNTENITWLAKPTYHVVNGTGRPKMARRIAGYIADNGLEVPSLGNAKHFGYSKSFIAYVPEFKESAEKLAESLPVPVELKEVKAMDHTVTLTLGKDLLNFDASIYYGTVQI